MALFLSSYQLVISKKLGDDFVGPGWLPEIVYNLHIPPSAVQYTATPANLVTPLARGAHVDYGRQFLGSLNVSVKTGMGQFLSSAEDGTPSMLDGQGRDEALRAFMVLASRYLEAGGYRMEFHADARAYHFQVVPGANSHSMSVGDSSRIGGANAELPFTVVRNLDGPAGLIGQIGQAIKSVKAAVGQILGAVAAVLEIVRAIVDLPNQIAALARSVIDGLDQCVAIIGQIVNGVAAAVNMPLTLLRAAQGLAQSVTDELVAIGNYSAADAWHTLDQQSTDLLAAAQQMAASASDGTQPSVSAAVALLDPAQYAAAKAVADPAASASMTNPLVGGGGAFDALADLDDATGWVPYVAAAGESLFDIAAEVLGDTDQWAAIAAINGLDSPFLTDIGAGAILKIPVQAGGIPFGVSATDDLKAAQAAMMEHIYYRDFLLRDTADGVDFTPNPTDPRGTLTVTGLPNFVQRYEKLGFRTELGSNPTFRDFGVFLGIGKPNAQSVQSLTRQSTRDLVYSDPRTVSCRVRSASAGPDFETVSLETKTQTASLVLVA